jgi:hypothetical protein
LGPPDRFDAGNIARNGSRQRGPIIQNAGELELVFLAKKEAEL